MHGRAAFLSCPYACIRIVPIGSECSSVNQIFGNLPWESSVTEQIFVAKQIQNIKKALTGALSILSIRRKNRAIGLKPEQEMAIYSLLHRRDVIAILSTGFGKSLIFSVFAMAKEEMSSSKTCMIAISPPNIIIDDQISEMLPLRCTAMEFWTETVNLIRESQLRFSLLLNGKE